MKLFAYIRSHLVWKLFLSYLVVLLVGAIVQITAADIVAARAFDTHLATMSQILGEMMGPGSPTEQELFSGFREAFTEALFVAALAGIGAALLASLFVSRQVGAPIRAMMSASQRIAEGEFGERVPLPDAPPDQYDELNQLALTFNRVAARLEQTEELRRQLIGDVAHELRTPLATIKGSMEGLMDGVLPANVETYEQIYREADRMQRLVADLQELSRVEAGAYSLNIKPVSIGRLVASVVARLGRQYEEKGVRLEIDVPDSLPHVQADADRMDQVLTNLVGNALQYTPPGGLVAINARQEGKEIRVAVADTGIGIAAEHLQNIFTRFYRVDKSRSRAGGGTGIGLTIAKYLVEAHHGRIWAESPGPGQGSTFIFTLPVSRNDATDD